VGFFVCSLATVKGTYPLKNHTRILRKYYGFTLVAVFRGFRNHNTGGYYENMVLKQKSIKIQLKGNSSMAIDYKGCTYDFQLIVIPLSHLLSKNLSLELTLNQ
jgi:hypothetical protein